MEKWGEREVTQGWRGEEREKMGDDRKGRIEGKRKRERRGIRIERVREREEERMEKDDDKKEKR